MTEKKLFNSNDFANVGNSLMNKDWNLISDPKNTHTYIMYQMWPFLTEWWHVYIPNYLNEAEWKALQKIYHDELDAAYEGDGWESPGYKPPTPEEFQDSLSYYTEKYNNEPDSKEPEKNDLTLHCIEPEESYDEYAIELNL